ncbi:MAG: RNA polymerase sigma factor [Bacteroidota bacterium]
MMNQEALWIEKAKGGDHRAFKSLYEVHVTPLFRFLRQFSSDTGQVEDWVQRAFIKAFEHLQDFQGRARFSSWLFTLGLNEMRMDRRRAQIVPMVPIEYDEFSSSESEPQQFDWNETMKAWMLDLDETKRAVFTLYEIEGYSHAEIAEMLNVAESTSRTLLSRTKRYLQERWKMEETRR